MSADAQRIVSLLPAATEMLYRVGAGPQVVGVSHECNWPLEAAALPRVTQSNLDSSAPSHEIDKQVVELMAAGRTLYELDRALLRELRPDLIVTQAQCDVCALPEAEVKRVVRDEPALRNAGVLTLNPTSVGEVLDDLERIGKAAGVAESARLERTALQERLDRVADERPPGEPPSVVVVEWLDPLMVASNWTPELIRLAGGMAPLGLEGAPSRYTDWSDIVCVQPDFLLIAPCGFDLLRTEEELEKTPKPSEWNEIEALSAGRAFAVDGDVHFNRPGPRLVDSVELLAQMMRRPAGETESRFARRVSWSSGSSKD